MKKYAILFGLFACLSPAQQASAQCNAQGAAGMLCGVPLAGAGLPRTALPDVFGVPTLTGTSVWTGAQTFPSPIGLSGSVSGTISITGQAATGTYNFNLPITAGTAGQPLISGGGGASTMAWGNLSGTTAEFVTTTGAQTAGNCVQIDASGNHVAAAGACGIAGVGANPPGGATGTVQYNSGAGVFGGITGATTNGVAMTLAGGLVTADPTLALGIASKQYVDTRASVSPLSIGASLVPTYVAHVVTTANTTNTSRAIVVASAAGIFPGQNIQAAASAAGIASFTVVTVVGTTVTMDQPATATLTGVSVTFGLQRYNTTSSLLANTLGAEVGLFGIAAVGNGNWTGLYDGPSRFSTGGGTGPGIGAIQCVSENGGRCASFYARSSDSALSGLQGVETITAVGVCDSVLSVYPGCGWTAYLEGNITAAANPPTLSGALYLVTESDMASQWTLAPADPYTVNNTGHTSIYRAASGKGYGPNNLTDKNISTGWECVSNPHAFDACIMIGDASVDTSTVPGKGILMPKDVGLTWYSGAATRMADVYGRVVGGFPNLAVHVPANGSMTFEVSTLPVFSVNAAVLFPSFNNALTLGDATLRFANMYSVLGNFSGGVTASGLPTSAGGGGLSVCVDTAGVLYKKLACP